MSLALYRKHRPLSLDALVGQEHIRPTLVAMLSKIANDDGVAAPHAILLTGPRGVGKTSVARILAHSFNRIEYKPGADHLDIIEIDGASHNKVDQIRDLVDKASILPATLPYKVYIIDEVHALAASQVSFQAFLKTLEEPPAHTIFILATTEVDKVPATIISRCQRFAFRSIPGPEMAKALVRLADLEKIELDAGASSLIADHSGGSLRDAISILDQLSSLGGKLTAAVVRQALGLPQADQVKSLVEMVRADDLIGSVNMIRQLLLESGASPTIVANEIIGAVRAGLVDSSEPQADIIWLEDLMAVGQARQPEAQIEIAIIRRIKNQPLDPSQDIADSPDVGIATKKVSKSQSQKPDPAAKETSPNKQATSKSVIAETKAATPIQSDGPPKETKTASKESAPAAKPTATGEQLRAADWGAIVDRLIKADPKRLAWSTLIQSQIDDVGPDQVLTIAFDNDFDTQKFDGNGQGRRRRHDLVAALKRLGYVCDKIEVQTTPAEMKLAPPPVEADVSLNEADADPDPTDEVSSESNAKIGQMADMAADIFGSQPN